MQVRVHKSSEKFIHVLHPSLSLSLYVVLRQPSLFDGQIDELEKPFRVQFRSHGTDLGIMPVPNRLVRLCGSLFHAVLCENVHYPQEIDGRCALWKNTSRTTTSHGDQWRNEDQLELLTPNSSMFGSKSPENDG